MNTKHVNTNLRSAALLLLVTAGLATAQGAPQRQTMTIPPALEAEEELEVADIIAREAAADSILSERFMEVLKQYRAEGEVRNLDEIIASIPTPEMAPPFNPLSGPRIFSGYRSVPLKSLAPEPFVFRRVESVTGDSIMETETVTVEEDSPAPELPVMHKDYMPDWLRTALTRERIVQNLMYLGMVENPASIDYAYWDLPVPPRLPEDDVSFSTYIKKLDLPEIVADETAMPTFVHGKKHWIHNAMAGVQFSQAYVSSNWYQGGNDYLALLVNLLWDVELNTVYHPNQMLKSTVSYKLGINKAEDTYHKYSISEDLFQWNFKAGLKAFKNFFWSYTLQFKTQFLNNYETNSDALSAAFLSPADLNMGIGMTYNYASKGGSLKVGVSLAPISYNMKACIDSRLDVTKFNIKPGHKVHNEIGSSAEVTAEWQLTSNISSRTRLFAFTDYTYFQGDLETTWNFTINKFLSTQLYVHMRYDSSIDMTVSKWRDWMMKEILSFGLTYTFSSKP